MNRTSYPLASRVSNLFALSLRSRLASRVSRLSALSLRSRLASRVSLLFFACSLVSLSQTRIPDLPAITGSAVDPAADLLWINDTSAGNNSAASKKITLAELVNVSSFTNGNFLAANAVEFSQVNGLQAALDGKLANTNSALNSSIGTDPAATRTAAQLGDVARYGTPLLHNYRMSRSAGNQPSILLFGDSMIGTAYEKLRRKIIAEHGVRGYGFLTGVPSAGAAEVINDCTKWINGISYTLPTGGEIVFALVGDTSVEGDTLKIYYNRQSGGGNFKVQSKLEGGSWTDEAAHLSVATDGATASQVISITKTTYRGRWQIKLVGISGTCSIIGAGIRDSKLSGALISECFNSTNTGNNMVDQAATPTAITTPVFADLGTNLIILSHLDGAASVPAQATVQDNIQTGITSAGGLPASFVVIGPPPGYDATTDLANVAQAEAMRALAATRSDTFWDNRAWALPVSSALSNGFLLAGDVHYQQKAAENWISQLWSWLDLNGSTISGAASPAEFSPPGGGRLRAYKPQRAGSFPALETLGNLVISRDIYAGALAGGELILEDMSAAGPADSNDYGKLRINGNRAEIIAPAHIATSQALAIDPGIGTGYRIFDTASTAAAPFGELGDFNRPWRALVLGKTITAAATTGARTISKATGSVNFAAGATSLVVTNTLAIAPTSGTTNTAGSIITATVRTDDATMKSVVVVCSSNGAFTLIPNAAPTGEVRVDFAIITP